LKQSQGQPLFAFEFTHSMILQDFVDMNCKTPKSKTKLEPSQLEEEDKQEIEAQKPTPIFTLQSTGKFKNA
jgi:hypothetical protein